MEKRIVTIIVGMFLVVGLIMGYQHRIQSMKTSALTPTPSVSPAVVNQKPRVLDPVKDKELIAVLKQSIVMDTGKSIQGVTIQSYGESDVWNWGTYIYSLGTAPEGGFYLAKKIDGQWQVSFSDKDLFKQWAKEVPIEVIGESGKQLFHKE